MAQENFYDILANEMKSELRAELKQQIAAEMNAEFASYLKQKDQSEILQPKSSLPKQQNIFEELFEITLIQQLEPKFFARKANKYPGKKEKPQKRPDKQSKEYPRVKRPLGAEESLTYELFVRLGACLPVSFNELELKKEFRRLAYKYHPDCQCSASEQNLKSIIEKFHQTRQCYEQLLGILEPIS